MALFKFELVSPQSLLVSTQVESVVIPGVDGEMTVLQNHAPVLLSLKTGLIRAEGETGKEARRWFIWGGGFADVSQTELTIFAEYAEAEENVDWEKMESDIKNAQEDLADAKVTKDRKAAEERLAYLQEMKAAFRK